MKQGQTLRQATRQKTDFRLIAANQVLQKGVLGLRQFIQKELSSNPALELTTDLLCPTCGFPLRNGECRFCSAPFSAFAPGSDAGGSLFPPYPAERENRRATEQAAFPETAAPISLKDHLREQAKTLLPARDHFIAEYLIANIGEKGLLECELEEVCNDLHLPTGRASEVLRVLQGLDPVGVGARDCREAVLIQIRHLAREREVDPLAEGIILHCWEDLAYHRYQKIARFLRCSEEEVRKSAEFIRANLNPYPANAFARQPEASAPQSLRWPDLIIHREKDAYRVEVVESYESELRISDSFLRLRQFLSRDRSISSTSPVALESLRRACFFLACLKMRKKTLQEVGECIARLQRGYLDTGLEEHLRPLTRSKVAALLGKHESTISRAVADKFVLLPSQQLVPFERFFTPGAGPKSIIRELTQREARGRPLTDKQICRILETRGYRVSRRTVAKYRLSLGIPPSTQRGH